MKKTTRILSLILTVVLILGAMVGCGANNTPAPGSQAPSSNQPANSEPVTMRMSWWGGDARHQATIEALEFYKEKTGVTIEGEYMGAVNDYRQKLFTQFAGGTAPDIVQLDAPWMPEIYKMGDMLVNLYDKQDIIDISGFDETFLKNYSIKDNNLYTLPTGINSLILTINKSVLEKAGIDPNQEWTWETFISEGRKVNEADSSMYFFNPDQVSLATVILKTYVIQKTGEQFIKDDYTIGFAREDLVEALNYLNRMIEAKVVQPASEMFQYSNKFETNPIWVNKQAGAIATWNSTITMWSKHILDTADVANIPIREDAKNTGVMVRPAQLLAVNANSKNVDEAVKFLDFFFNSEDSVKILKDARSVQPTVNGRKICNDNNLVNPLVTKAAEIGQSKAGIVYNDLSNNQELIDIFSNTVEEVGLGKYTPEQAADKMISTYESKLAEFKEVAGK